MPGGHKTVNFKFAPKTCVFKGRRDFGHAVYSFISSFRGINPSL